jgi:hypothetical protein
MPPPPLKIVSNIQTVFCFLLMNHSSCGIEVYHISQFGETKGHFGYFICLPVGFSDIYE